MTTTMPRSHAWPPAPSESGPPLDLWLAQAKFARRHVECLGHRRYLGEPVVGRELSRRQRSRAVIRRERRLERGGVDHVARIGLGRLGPLWGNMAQRSTNSEGYATCFLS